MTYPSMDSRYGAIVLCGGESSRMGRDKAWLPWGPDSTLLQHAVATLERVVPARNIVVVASHDQRVPTMPADVVLINESAETSGSGPLAALAQGLVLNKRRKSAVFVCGCDAPLLRNPFVRRMLEIAAADSAADVVVPSDGRRLYPLAAVYRPDCSGTLLDAYMTGERSIHRVLRNRALTIREVSIDDLRDADPKLDSLVNCNTPEEYEWALRRGTDED